MKKIDELFSLDIEKDAEKAVEDFKAESYAMPAKFITKDEGADQEIALKVQVLVDKLKEYKEKLMNLRDQNLEAAKITFEKTRELEKLKIEKELLEKQLDEVNVFQGGKGGKGGIFTIKNKSNAEEDNQRRQKVRNELMMGISLVEADLKNFGGRRDQKEKGFRKFLNQIWNIFNMFVILKADVKRIESRYDRSIGSYFSFFKFLVNLSIAILAIYGYLLVSHLFKYNGSLISFCEGSLCFTLFYAFSTSEALTYSISLVAMIAATVIVSISK